MCWTISLTQAFFRYLNVHIDPVHYCEREAELVASRKQRAFSGRKGDLRDPAHERLQLFNRAVRERDIFAKRVQSLKLPYMTREICKGELARTLSVLPQLRYVDLPDSFFSDSPSSDVLKQELQSRCPNIRWMKYAAGSESSFVALGNANYWRSLEEMELCNIGIDMSDLTYVLSSLSTLRAVSVSGLSHFDDSVFLPSSQSAPFPPLTKLQLRDLPNITIAGLTAYFSRTDVSRAITSLTLSNTGVQSMSIHAILSSCPNLRTMRVTEDVEKPFPITLVPPLASRSLRTLKYELGSLNSSQGATGFTSNSYYSYLANSILQGHLPALVQLYALSTSLPSMLLHKPSNGTRMHRIDDAPRIFTFSHTLCLYTKSVSELEWDLTVINPAAKSDQTGSSVTATRPMSLYNPPPLSPQWRDKGRESVMVGNGFGGFLMVPSQESGPLSPGKKPPRKERDAWMG